MKSRGRTPFGAFSSLSRSGSRSSRGRRRTAPFPGARATILLLAWTTACPAAPPVPGRDVPGDRPAPQGPDRAPAARNGTRRVGLQQYEKILFDLKRFHPAEFEELCRLREADYPAFRERLRRILLADRVLNLMRRRYPKEYERLTRLRIKDPEAFYREILSTKNGPPAGSASFRKGGRPPRPPILPTPDRNRIRELSEMYRTAQTPEERDRIRSEARAILERRFDESRRRTANRIAQIRRDLDRLEERNRRYEADRDRIIDRRLREMFPPD